MKVSAQYYELARRWMRMARRRKRAGDPANASFMAREARAAIRTARTWEHTFERSTLAPWPEAAIAMAQRIQPLPPRKTAGRRRPRAE